MTQTQLLIIAPETGITPADDYLESLAYQMLDAQKPTDAEIAARGLRAVSGVAGTIAGLFLERPSARLQKGFTVHGHKDILVELLRALCKKDVASVLPGAMVVKSSDQRLAQWSVLGSCFLSESVYAAHPCDHSFFIPLAGFHNYLIDEKRAEFVRIASALGASSIRLVFTEDAAKGASASAGFTDPTGRMDVGTGVESKTAASTQFDLNASFEHPTRQPCLPGNLRWLSREPLWQAMADARLLDDVSTFQVKFQYQEDFAVNAKLSATVTGLGLSAGGTFTTMQRVSQTYEVSFHPRSAYEKVRNSHRS